MESKAYYSSFEEMYLDNYKLVILFIRDYISENSAPLLEKEKEQ